ncbi:DUF937 domain-containing protein [Erythrobacter sp. YT30]|uniref:DUF937 domain-containing protein n=1 Tax=Erythrobacter sp. YT30 TaxID=1735012 RepID=UPI00076D5E85|nr:DUF937 domain-containing protein [Erythrobacter sp. YT30]KWV90470.1 hypothetical protein AUC45_14615 [Erythrobacter sp. YT30]
MSLAQMLQQTGAISSMARELGIDESTAKTAAGALLPAIVAGMGRSATGGTSTPEPLGGLGSLAGAILGGSGSGGGASSGGIGGMLGGAMLDAVLGSSPTPTQPGNDILGNIFGSKDVSRSVAGEVAALTGLDEGMLKKMLPILAMAVGGYLAKSASSGGAAPSGSSGGNNPLGGILGSIVGGMMR